MYQWLLKEFQEERKSGLRRGQRRQKAGQPPSERAARLVQGNLYKHKNWKAVLNQISSQKRARLFMNE